jgi:hypothetical protein
MGVGERVDRGWEGGLVGLGCSNVRQQKPLSDQHDRLGCHAEKDERGSTRLTTDEVERRPRTLTDSVPVHCLSFARTQSIETSQTVSSRLNGYQSKEEVPQWVVCHSSS